MQTEAVPLFIAYYRLSTASPGASGLGLTAQKEAVRAFVESRNGHVIGEFTEIESGGLRARPELKRALAECGQRRATLVIARLDRLARNLYVIASLVESRVEFVAADMPSASKLTIQLIAAIAEHERDQISANTRAALQAAKQRGAKLGNPRLAEARPNATLAIQRSADEFAHRAFSYIRKRGYEGLALNKIAELLNREDYQTQRGRSWTATGVRNVFHRVARQQHQDSAA